MLLTKIFILSMIHFTSFLGLKAKYDKHILICYGRLDVTEIKNYNLLILESNHYTKKEIALLRKHNTKVIAYISLTEISKNASNYIDFNKVILKDNKNWNSSYLDLKNKNAQSLLKRQIKELVEKGFNGLFLDNIDNVGPYGFHPEMKTELLSIIKFIRKHYPKIYLIQNSGLDIIEETSTYIDEIAKESVFTSYNFETKLYKLKPKKDYLLLLKEFKHLGRKYKKSIFFIEYADSLDLKRKVQKRVKKSGVLCFISTIDLQTIPNY